MYFHIYLCTCLLIPAGGCWKCPLFLPQLLPVIISHVRKWREDTLSTKISSCNPTPLVVHIYFVCCSCAFVFFGPAGKGHSTRSSSCMCILVVLLVVLQGQTVLTPGIGSGIWIVFVVLGRRILDRKPGVFLARHESMNLSLLSVSTVQRMDY